MNIQEAKEEIFALITTLKLTEKEIITLEEEVLKWEKRIELALSGGKDELALEAEKEAQRIKVKLAELWEEKHSYRNSIDALRRQLPGLAARERSIDPDVLEQELLMALGHTEEEAETERVFRKLEEESTAEIALNELKAKMRGDSKPL